MKLVKRMSISRRIRVAQISFFFFLFLIFRSADEISTKISKVWTVFNVRYKISISISRWVEHVRDSRLDLESELHSDLENSTSRVMIIA